MLPTGMTLSNFRPRENALTMDVIRKELPSQNRVSLALDGWTSTNKLFILLDIAYYMD